jgi:small-conductance mechanosensitive channel
MDLQKHIYNTYDEVKENIVQIIPKIIVSLIIFLLFLSLAKYYKSSIIDAGFNKTVLNTQYIPSEIKHGQLIDTNSELYKKNLLFYELANIIYYLIITVGCIFAIINLGIHTSTIITILGTLGLAIGLAIQGTLTNITSGVYIGFNDLFKIGDIININGFTGKVQKFSLFNTILTDKAGSELVIPNNLIQSNILTNLTPDDE